MTDDTIILPQVIQQDHERTKSIFVYKHISQKQVLKNKILLQQNLISLLQKGEKVIHYADKTTIVSSSQFAILSAGSCLFTEKLSADNDYSSLLLFFDNEAFANFFIKYASWLACIKKDYITMKEPFVVLDKDEYINNFASSMDFMLQSNLPFSEEMKQLKFEELMLYLFEKYPQAMLSFHESIKNGFLDFDIKKAVESNITSNVTLEELAFLCNTSLSTFKRRFIKIYNSAPNQYFLHRKMEIAANLLLHHNENPSNVFYKVGYENLSSFSQSFKQIYGLSPKQYQQQNLAN